MLAELQNSENWEPTDMSTNSWPCKMKTLPIEGEELAKATNVVLQKKINTSILKNVMESKPTKKTCICAPTSHAGSFRCHLHRATSATQKASWSVEKEQSPKSNTLNLKNMQPQLSRLGRSASAKTSHACDVLAATQ